MSRKSSAVAAAAVAVVSAGIALACRDTSTGPSSVPTSRSITDAAGTGLRAPPQPATGAAARSSDGDARARLRARNRLAWVGVAHNAALDAFRDELLKPGIRSRDLCSYLLTFATSDARVPSERAEVKTALSIDARRRGARKVLAATQLCASQFAEPTARIGRSVSLASFVPAHRSPTRAPSGGLQSGGPSQAAYDLYYQIEAAIDAATNSYDLASRLNPILSAAAQLSFEEHATIAATVSVAQSSYEYWEPNYQSYADAVYATYGVCIDEAVAIGYTLDGVIFSCTNGSGGQVVTPAVWRTPRRGLREGIRPPLLMSVAAPRTWGGWRQSVGVGEGLKRIGKADANGAFTGAFVGAFAGGWEGAAAGGLLGGAGASIAMGLGLVIGEIYHHRYR